MHLRPTHPKRAGDLSFPVFALTVLAIGLTLLAEGLRNWRTYTLRIETVSSQSPIPYHASLSAWRSMVERAGLESDWYLAVTKNLSRGMTNSDEICRLVTATAAGASLAILQLTSTGPFGASRCNASSTASGPQWPILRQTAERIGLAPESLPPDGSFVIMDSSYAVVYGSRRLTDLRYVGKVLELFASPQEPR